MNHKNSTAKDAKLHSRIRAVLNQEFLRRRENNPSYSLRGFARSLNLDPTQLGRIMKGERKPASVTIAQILSKLDQLQMTTPLELSDDHLSIIPRWYYFAILDFFLLPDFKSDLKWIAKRLDLPYPTVRSAIDILLQTGFIEKQEGQLILRANTTSWSRFDSTSTIRKNLQRQITLQAADAIDNVPYQYRESSSLTIPCSTKALPKIRERIYQFKQELQNIIQNHSDPDEVYQLSVNFFPLTQVPLEKNTQPNSKEQ